MSKVIRQMRAEDNELSSSTTKKVQRAVIFQGGGALGGYAAGVYAVLYYWVKKNIDKNNEHVFDIVAGTSAGAINASVIVSHVASGKNTDRILRWEGSVKKLLDFWSYVSSSPNFTKWKPFFSYFWPFFGNEKTGEQLGMNQDLETERQEKQLEDITQQRSICIMEHLMYFHIQQRTVMIDSLTTFGR